MEQTLRRVVVTGLGAITPVGNTVEEMWANLKAGVHGIAPITLFDTTDYKTKMFMIQMKNSKDPDIPFTRQSTKDDSTLHGHGLSIIESIAKGYGGTCQWSVEDDSFLSLIMLKHT